MMKPDALLYLTVKSSVQGQWFKAQVMGVEKRNSFRKDICKAVEFPQKQTTPGEKHLRKSCRIMMFRQII